MCPPTHLRARKKGCNEAIYRIAQESPHNTVAGPRASLVHAELARDGNHITLELRDNGVGFDSSGQFPGHRDLHSMRERTARFRGSFAIEVSPRTGTRTRVKIPLHPTPQGY